MAGEMSSGMLAPPAVTALREQAISPGTTGTGDAKGYMQRTLSEDIREERDDLKRAAEQSLNAIMDLNLDGTIRWISPSWEDLTGVNPDTVVGKPMPDIIYDNKNIFADAVQAMRTDDTKSRIIRFAVKCVASTPQVPGAIEEEKVGTLELEEETQPAHHLVNLEAQGIMIYDRSDGHESHTMWMIKPAIRREITIDLPDVLIEGLGIGAHVLAQYLTTLAEMGTDDPAEHPPPPPVLCRICERQITPWWFEKHTELCLQEHRAEMEVQMAQESLTEHRSSIVRVLDALEVQARQTRPGSSESTSSSSSPTSQVEYKGQLIGPSSTPSSGPSSGRASPAATNTQRKPRDSSRSGLGHTRARSFAVRRPLARIVELVLDLCDTALEISPPAVKDVSGQPNTEIRTQSPQSESRISQVLQWQSPSAGTLESEHGLSLLCDDTSHLSKAKVEAVFRHRRILEYSERLRIEFHVLVQECIDEALAKAARIAAGEISDSSDESSSSTDRQEDDQPSDVEPTPRVLENAPDEFAVGSYASVGPPSLAAALRDVSGPASLSESWHGASSAGGSSRSNSPHGTRTPRSYGTSSVLGNLILQKRGSMMPPPDSDTGADSDTSMRSSLASATMRTDSPGPESLSLHRVASSRERKRRSLALPSLQATSRQPSPTRGINPPSSPLRMAKRVPSGGDTIPSPLTSPMLLHSDFPSPILRAQQTQHYHHRRRSSAQFSEPFRTPASPKLTAASSNPQPRAIQTSIKDFEIIKPISKGAFGSVYLAKKKVTGDYYAIKVLKKSDMVAKNQVTNVKAERAIMMWQGESDFVAKLYWTFSSKDYLYLVMEYLNGGDLASLIKTLGGLSEEWAKKYVAEVIMGVQHLHERQIVHRDLKPDNLLIDPKGHLKLTDFGLSRMGLIGRQKRIQSSGGKLSEGPDLVKLGLSRKAASGTSSRSTSLDFKGDQSPALTPSQTPALTGELGQPSYFSLTRETSREAYRRTSGQRSDSENSDALQAMFRRFSLADDPQRRTPIEEETDNEGESPEPIMLQPTMSDHVSASLSSTPPPMTGMFPPPMALFDPQDSSRRFVGTPDYLAPETISGIGQDEMSDWWSLGCIMFECLYGYPPFHADSPEEVFQNILARRIDWPDPDEWPVSEEAVDLMNGLMSIDPKQRLGANIKENFPSGGDEIRAHSWFADIDWSHLREDDASFIPAPANLEDTEYFDSRGATLQNFQAEFEDQASSPAQTPGADYPDRPHDALSRVRSQVNSIKRGLMPLHIPPHVRDGRSRRLSEPMVADDFGNFQFKNLPVLEKANKDVIQKLRAEAMQAQSKSLPQAPSSPAVSSPSPSLESSPVLPGPLKRTMSSNKGNNRPASPSLLSQSNSSPSRASQPSSPLLVSFSAGKHHERRKTSCSGSALANQISASLQPDNMLDAPRLPAGFKSLSTASSPIKIPKAGSVTSQTSSQDKYSYPTRHSSLSSSRQRSLTVGSQDEDAVPEMIPHHKRRSMVFDVSPSSSDNEEQRSKRTEALLRVQRRRASSRRLSQVTLAEGPAFRPLDVLICEDHPVSRMVMERLLEKLRCRTISVQNGSEATRYALSEVKFDIIMLEYKLPQINGADVARMVRDTKNANSHTPIVCITGYLKELQGTHHFDALVEKPPTTTKLTEVMSRLCQWKAPPPGWTPAHMPILPPSSLRKESSAREESPTTSSLSGYGGMLSNSYRGSSREDSIGSSSFGEMESQYNSIPVIISRETTNDWNDSDLERNFGGLGLTSPDDMYAESEGITKPAIAKLPALKEQTSAPGQLETVPVLTPRKQRSSEAIEAKRRSLEKDRHECAESGDDEDEELGNVQIRARSPRKSTQPRSSKLGTEMMRTNSQGSIVSGEEMLASHNLHTPPNPIMEEEVGQGGLTPPEIFPREPGHHVEEIDMDATPKPHQVHDQSDTEPTPRPQHVKQQQQQHITTPDPDPNPTPRASTSPMHRD
ncbi:hypothetical protein BDV97DRAFT_300535 [Delphinella strobiligena]|nr:hypothetical protein BDV97DRAFT_300535 [Delphinella strobiligena]